MAKYAEYFMTVNDKGEMVAITYARPAHELTENQVMLTYDEYKLLDSVKSIEAAHTLLGAIGMKVEKLLNAKG